MDPVRGDAVDEVGAGGDGFEEFGAGFVEAGAEIAAEGDAGEDEFGDGAADVEFDGEEVAFFEEAAGDAADAGGGEVAGEDLEGGAGVGLDDVDVEGEADVDAVVDAAVGFGGGGEAVELREDFAHLGELLGGDLS